MFVVDELGVFYVRRILRSDDGRACCVLLLLRKIPVYDQTFIMHFFLTSGFFFSDRKPRLSRIDPADE
jgi:hypothetical protein